MFFFFPHFFFFSNSSHLIVNAIDFCNPRRYRVVGATIIERMPKLTPDKQQWELDYEELFFRRRNVSWRATADFFRCLSSRVLCTSLLCSLYPFHYSSHRNWREVKANRFLIRRNRLVLAKKVKFEITFLFFVLFCCSVSNRKTQLTFLLSFIIKSFII